MNQFKIGYFADGQWSHQALAKLTADSSIRIAFICARFDNPDPVLREQAALYGIRFLTHEKINSEEFLQLVGEERCDLFVSMSFNQIFRKKLIERPRLQTINCHAGKLPYYRGRNILNWALINGETDFGITVHLVDEGIDTGDILAQNVLAITDEDDYSTLLNRAYEGCAELLYETVKRLQNGIVSRTPQKDIHPLGFYCVGRMNGDEKLNWNSPSRAIFNFVRAICRPGPEARTYLDDVEIRINRVEWLPTAPVYIGIPGSVVGIEADAFFVKTADSFVRVVEWTGVEKLRIGMRLK